MLRVLSFGGRVAKVNVLVARDTLDHPARGVFGHYVSGHSETPAQPRVPAHTTVGVVRMKR